MTDASARRFAVDPSQTVIVQAPARQIDIELIFGRDEGTRADQGEGNEGAHAGMLGNLLTSLNTCREVPSPTRNAFTTS